MIVSLRVRSRRQRWSKNIKKYHGETSRETPNGILFLPMNNHVFYALMPHCLCSVNNSLFSAIYPSTHLISKLKNIILDNELLCMHRCYWVKILLTIMQNVEGNLKIILSSLLFALHLISESYMYIFTETWACPHRALCL